MLDQDGTFHKIFFNSVYKIGLVLGRVEVTQPRTEVSAAPGATVALDPIVVRARGVATVALLTSAVGALIARLLALVATALEVGLLVASTAGGTEDHVQNGRVAPLAGAEQAVCHVLIPFGSVQLASNGWVVLG